MGPNAPGRYRAITGLEHAQMAGSANHVCEDCGSIVLDRTAHDRFHAIGNDVGRSLAILQVSHIAAHVHDRYDAFEKIQKGRNPNNWSMEALAQVAGINSPGDLFSWCEDPECPMQPEGKHVH